MSITLKFENYYRPENTEQVLEILKQYKGKAEVIAGGTDVIPQRPGGSVAGKGKILVDITRMGLDTIRQGRNGIYIGAAATINSIGDFPLFSTLPYLSLSQAAARHSTQTIRNRATIGGNLCNASPCADFAPPLLVMNARLHISGIENERQLSVRDFYLGPNFSALGDGEILKDIFIPFCKTGSVASFQKFGRQQTLIDMALANAAAFLTLEESCITTARIAVGATGPVPFRAAAAELFLSGKKLDSKNIEQAAEMAAAESEPIDDFRATAAYRKKMVKVMVRRVLIDCLERCEA